MLNIYSDNFPVPKDDDISTVDHVLRYYETINLDIEGSKKILETFDSVHRGFKVPSPSQEAIAAATARTEGVSNVVPSGSAGDLVRILDDSNPAQPQEPVPSPAPAPMPPQPQEPSPAPMPPQPQEPVPSPTPMPPQEPVPSQGPRPQPDEEIQENISIYEIDDGEHYDNYTTEVKIAGEQLKKLNIELGKPPGKTKLVIKPGQYKKAKQDYLDALNRGKTLSDLNKQIEIGFEDIAKRRGTDTKIVKIEINNRKILKDARNVMESKPELGENPTIEKAKENMEDSIAYLRQQYEVIQEELKGLTGGSKKKKDT